MKFSTALKMSGLGVAAAMVGEPNLDGYTYEHYRKEFGKFYSTAEHNNREIIFNKNLALIKEHNTDQDKSWYADINQFTDLTNDEFKYQFHGHKPHNPSNLPGAVKGESFNGDISSLPDSVDWRDTKGVVTPVKNQGGCGSCWAFSTVETLESHLAIATGKDAPILSPQQVVSCAPNPQHCGGTGGCQGSTQPLGFNYTESAGITTEAAYSYEGRTGTCTESKIKPVAKNTGYTVLKTNDYGELMNAVATKGPVAISVAAGSFGWQLYGGGVFSSKGCGFDMDHAIQLVGYGTDGDKMYWNVRNSWGAGWGEKGYMRIERFGDGKEPCGMDKTPQDGAACEGDKTPKQYCGLCGIMSASSYPTGVTEV